MGVNVSKTNRIEAQAPTESDITRTIRQITDNLATVDYDNPDEEMMEITKLEMSATQLETNVGNLDDKSTLRNVCKTFAGSLSSALTAKKKSIRVYKARMEDQKKEFKARMEDQKKEFEMKIITCGLERDKQVLQKEADKGALEKGLGTVGNYADSAVKGYFNK